MSYIPKRLYPLTGALTGANRLWLALTVRASPRRLPGEFGLTGAPSGHRARLPPIVARLSVRDSLLLLFTAFAVYGRTHAARRLVELRGFEPLASSVRLRRSPK